MFIKGPRALFILASSNYYLIKMKNYLACLLVSLCSLGTSWGQSGIIRGQVNDATNGEPLIGTSVLIQGTTTGAITDLDGKFSIENVTPGVYNLRISYVSYETKIITDVVVNGGEVTVLNNIKLAETYQDLGEVVVTAEAIRSSESALLTIQKKSPVVLDAIAAEAFSRSGDRDAASAVGRVTGVSVEGGKYVYVRGLGDRYSQTALNGAKIPGLDPNKNTVQLDLFPSSLIDNIVVYKTFSPNLPGDFTGGYVDVVTKDFPESFTLQITGGLGYNAQASWSEDFLTYQGGETDWLGFDDGTRDFPSLLDVNDRNSVPSLPSSLVNQNVGNRLTQITKAFNEIMAPTRESQFLNHNFSLAVGNQTTFLGKPFGFVGSLSYQRDFQSYHNGETGRYKLTENEDLANSLVADLNLLDAKSDDNVLWGAMLNGSVKLNEYNKVSLNLLRNQSGQTTARLQSGVKPGDEAFLEYFTNTLLYEQRSLSSAQLKGEHAFGDGQGLSVEWISSFTLSTMEQPDLRFFTYGFTEIQGFRIQPSIGQLPTRYTREMEQYNFDNKLDFTLPFKQWNGLESKLKFGGAFTFKDRDFREFQYRYNQNGTDFNLAGGNPEAYIANDNVWIFADRFSQENPDAVWLSDAFQAPNNYQAEQSVISAYLMTDLPLSDRFRAILGARMETTETIFSSEAANFPNVYPNFADLMDKTLQDQVDILPSVNLVYALSDASSLRVSYNKTLARPSFRELAPFESFDFVGDYKLLGNSELKITKVDNVDLRWEVFPRGGELLSLSGFYKKFTNPIERSFNPTSANPLLVFRNVDEALVYGVELEAKKRLDFISPSLKNILVGANFTYVQSEVDIAPDELEAARALAPSTASTRDMTGQSPFIVNAFMNFADEKNEANAVFNVQGERLAIVLVGGTPNIVEKPRPSLNLNYSRRISDRFKARISANNLLDPETRFVYPFKGQDLLFQDYRTGREFSLSLSYTVQ